MTYTNDLLSTRQAELVQDGEGVAGEQFPPVIPSGRPPRTAMASHVERQRPKAGAEQPRHRSPTAPMEPGPMQHQDRLARCPRSPSRPGASRPRL